MSQATTAHNTMRALVKREAGKGIWMEQVPVPTPGPNEVLIKLEKTAICGTDLHIYLWDEWSQRTIKPGLTIGHEFVGRIAELGPGVSGYKVGQRVSAEGHIVCGHCRNCRGGRPHLCPHTVGIGVNRNGAFAEYMTMPASNLWPIPDQIPSELAAFFDPYGNAAHCALEFDVVGEDVLITGAGHVLRTAGVPVHLPKDLTARIVIAMQHKAPPPSDGTPAPADDAMAQAVERTVPADADLVWASPWREGPDHCETLRQQLQ